MEYGRDLNHHLRCMVVKAERDIEERPPRLRDRPQLLVAVLRQPQGVVNVDRRQIVYKVGLRGLEVKW